MCIRDRHIGENRVQESEKKIKKIKRQPLLGLTKRFIGHLQSNKVNKCLDVFDTIDSVHSFKLAKRISKRAVLIEKTVPVLLEVKTSDEKRKFGFGVEEIERSEQGLKKGNLEFRLTREAFQGRSLIR